MGERKTTVADAIAEGAALAGWAWQRAGLVQLAAAIGPALLFIALRAPLWPSDAAALAQIGLIVSLAAWAPLWVVLHRLALGGGAAERIVRGGLQFGPAELRFLALACACGLAAVLAVLPLVAVSAAIFVVFHDLGPVRLGAVGPVPGNFVVAGAVWLAGAAGLAYAALRLSLAPAATVIRRRLVLTEAWALTRGQTGSVTGAWILAQAPALLCFALLGLLESFERLNPATAGAAWPMPHAVLAGGLLGLVIAFLQAPLTAGVLGFLYRERQVDWPVAEPAQPQGAPSLA